MTNLNNNLVVLNVHSVVDSEGGRWIFTGPTYKNGAVECGEYGIELSLFNRLVGGEKIKLNTSIGFLPHDTNVEGDLDFSIIIEDEDGEIGYVDETGMFNHPELTSYDKECVLDFNFNTFPSSELEALVYFGVVNVDKLSDEFKSKLNLNRDRYLHIQTVSKYFNSSSEIIQAIATKLAGSKFNMGDLVVATKLHDVRMIGEFEYYPIIDFNTGGELDDDGFDDDSMNMFNIVGMLNDVRHLVADEYKIIELDSTSIKFSIEYAERGGCDIIEIDINTIKCGDRCIKIDEFDTRSQDYNKWLMMAYIRQVTRK